MRPTTSHGRAEKLFRELERLAVSADAEWSRSVDSRRRVELREEIAMYLSLMTPLAIVLDLHLPMDCRGADAPNDAYSLLLSILDS